MFNKVIPFINERYHKLNIVIVEPSKFHRAFLSKAIADNRPYHSVTLLENMEQVFVRVYGEMKIDVIFFDLESNIDINNIAILKAVSPKMSFVHWSYCKHPEIIEYLHELEVNSFCLKDSTAPTLITAIDSIATNPNILFVDERLNKCLPLLAS